MEGATLEKRQKNEDLEKLKGLSGVWLFLEQSNTIRASSTNAPVHVNTKTCTFFHAQPLPGLTQPSCGGGGALGAKCSFPLLPYLQLNYCLWPLLLNVRVDGSRKKKHIPFSVHGGWRWGALLGAIKGSSSELSSMMILAQWTNTDPVPPQWRADT